MKQVLTNIEENPIIAAIEEDADYYDVVESPVKTVFLLRCDIISLKGKIAFLKEHNKIVFLHVDLVQGLGCDQMAVQYIYENSKPDGIITTKNNIVKYGKDLGLCTIQRFFMVDSHAYSSAVKTIEQTQPDAVEIMPGVMPKLIKEFSKDIRKPIIAGGLINTKEDIIAILSAGALGISTSKSHLWNLV